MQINLVDSKRVISQQKGSGVRLRLGVLIISAFVIVFNLVIWRGSADSAEKSDQLPLSFRYVDTSTYLKLKIQRKWTLSSRVRVYKDNVGQVAPLGIPARLAQETAILTSGFTKMSNMSVDRRSIPPVAQFIHEETRWWNRVVQ